MSERTAGFPPSGAELLEMIRVLPDVLFRCEKREDGNIYWTFNEGRLAEEFGLTTREIEGKSLEELFPGGASDALREHFEAAFSGRPSDFVNEIGGRYFRHHPQPIHTPDGRVEAVVGFITEVTESVQAQEVIKELNAEMMNRVLELNEANEALRSANAELRQANQDLDSFAYTVSHDLRTPITVIQNLCYVLSTRHADCLGEDGVGRLERIRDASRRMDRLITDVLRFSRASRSPLEPKEVDLTGLARDHMAESGTGEGTDWEVEDGLVAKGDPGLLQIVVENLLSNAVKYTRNEPQPRIRFARESSGAGTDVFVVEDNGIGFGPTDVERVFDAFGRLENAQAFEGSGIGLATVRRIVERHGGKVWAEPVENGARFLFTLPAPRQG